MLTVTCLTFTLCSGWHKKVIQTVSPVQAPGRNAPLIWFLISALYMLFACLYRMLPHFSFFFIFSPPLSFPLRIDPLHFQAGCRKRQLNLALDSLCLFCVVVHLFGLMNTCFCYVRFSFFHTESIDWLEETSPKWPILCRVGCETTTQSVQTMRIKWTDLIWVHH